MTNLKLYLGSKIRVPSLKIAKKINMKPQSSTEVNHNAEEIVKYRKVEKKTGRRIGYNYIIMKSLKESPKNDVVKCMYIKSLTKFGLCVIKEGTCGDTKDKEGRDIKDRLIWQKQLHELLQHKVRLPKLLDSFEENGNYYLVIEYIKGRSLASVCKKHSKVLRESLLSGNKLGEQFLDYLIQLIDLLHTLHNNHIVHRDATCANFMISPSGKVNLIDMELSYSLKLSAPSPPFKLGTQGYMSPQQEATLTPTIEEDIFSVGAILSQVWSSVSPIKLTGSPLEELIEKIRFFVPDQLFADIIIRSLHPEANKRPTLNEIKNTVTQYKSDLKKKKHRSEISAKKIENDKIIDTIQQSISTLASPLLADEENGWFADKRNNQPNADKNKIIKAWYTSFNLGGTGALYVLSRLHNLGFNVDTTAPHIEKLLALINKKYITNVHKNQPGLHFGSDGIAACLTTAIQVKLIPSKPEYLDWINYLLSKVTNSLGITHGISGQGMANLVCRPVVQSQLIDDRLKLYVQSLLEKQEKDGSWARSTTDKKQRVTRGFAHGVAGIIYFLLEYAQHYNDQEAIHSAGNGLRWLIKKSSHHKGYVDWASSKNKSLSPWWCEGAPGIGLTFIKAYQLLKDQQYKEFATKALLSNPQYIIDNNLSQCHGISGLGEIYLEAYHVLKDSIWLERAGWIAQTIMQLKKQHIQYGPFWLVEHERQPLASFMTGNSGIIHFLLRYCYPENLSFPMTPPSPHSQTNTISNAYEISSRHQVPSR